MLWCINLMVVYHCQLMLMLICFFWLLVICFLFIMHLQAPIRWIWVYHDWTSKSPSKNARNMCIYVYMHIYSYTYVYIYIYIYTWISLSIYPVINRAGIYRQHFIVGRQPNIPGREGMGRSWFGLRGGWSQLHCQSRRWSWWSWGTPCVFGKNNNGILGIVWWIGELIYIYIYTHIHIHT